MEAFESFVALALEAEDFVVAGPMKFKHKMQTKNKKSVVFQEHGYEIDLVGAKADKLVLASVKGFFGSGGVRPLEVTGEAGPTKSSGYKLLNDTKLRDAIVKQAAEKFGYKPNQVELRLYGGIFKGGDKGLDQVRTWAQKQIVGGAPIGVYSGSQIAEVVVKMAQSKTYRNHEILLAIKTLSSAGFITRPETTKPVLSGAKKQIPAAQNKAGKHESLNVVIERLPVGATVRSSKDGLTGVVLGHKQDAGKAAYVYLWVDGALNSHLRAASTLASL